MFQKRINCTPLEKATKRKPDLSKLPIFGCKSFIYNQHKSKLDPRANIGVFIGFDTNSPAKLIYNPHTGEVQKAQDVRFLDTLYYSNQINHPSGLNQNNSDNVIPPDISQTPILDHNEISPNASTHYNLRRKPNVCYNCYI